MKYITLNNQGHIQSVIQSNDKTLKTDGYIDVEDIENSELLSNKPYDFKVEIIGDKIRAVELSEVEKQEKEPKIEPVRNIYKELQDEIMELKKEVELLKNKKNEIV